MTEVYEVATFYHHFDVVKDGAAAPAGDHGARLRFDRVRAGGRAGAARERCPSCSAPTCACSHAPCIGRCEQAPAAAVGQNPVPCATPERIQALVRPPRYRASAVEGRRTLHARVIHRGEEHAGRGAATRTRSTWATTPIGTAGGYRLIAGLPGRQARSRDKIIETDGALGPARARRRGVSGRTQVADRTRRAAAEGRGDQHRRGRAGHVQGPRLPRARSAPLHRRDARRRVGGAGRRLLRVSPRRVPWLPRDPGARAREARGRSALRAAADRSSTRRGRLHLRRRIGDDRVDRGQAWHAAPAPAVRRAGRALRLPDARAQHGDRVLGARHRRARRRSGSPASAATAARVCARSPCPAG